MDCNIATVNLKQVWQYVKSKPKTKTRQYVVNLKIDPDGEGSDDNLTRIDYEKASILNDFFASVFFTNEHAKHIPK